MNPWKGSRQFLATDRVFTGDAWSIIGENSRRKDRDILVIFVQLTEFFNFV